MRKIVVVAVREYLAAVRTKAFVVSLVIMPLLMGGSLVVQWLLRDLHDTRDKHFAVVDRTPGARVYPLLEQVVAEHNKDKIRDPATGKQVAPRFVLHDVPPSADDPNAVWEQRIDLSGRVRKGEFFGVLEIGPDVLEPMPARTKEPDERHAIRYQSDRPTHRDFPQLVEKGLSPRIEALRYANADLKPSLAEVRALLARVPVDSKGLSERNPATGEFRDDSEGIRFAAVGVPIGLMMLMFTVIMMGATPQMQGVVEEKMQRVAEVLLGSVRPFDLMLGKLLGMTAVSLTIATVYLGGAYWAAHRYGFDRLLSVELLVWFIVFQSLASLMYGSLFIAVGAACTDMKETQNLLWPVMLLAVFPMFLLGSVLQEPNSTVATAASFFPFATPMLMIARAAVPPGLPWWQPAVGVVVVLLTSLLCVYAAGRIFRVGILMQGKGARLADMARWVFRG
jgi:ABC-2 type transport system permease protein